MEKYGTGGQITDDNMTHAHCMLEQILITFPVQQWLQERALMLRLYVHCLSSLLRTAAMETVWCISNKSPTRCNNFPVYDPDVYLQINVFRASSRPSSGAHDCSSSPWYYLRIVVIAVLCSWLGRPARPRTQHGYHHDTKAIPEAATAAMSS